MAANANNQTLLTQYVAMRGRATGNANGGDASIASINTADVQTLADWVNNTAQSQETGMSAMQIVLTNASGRTGLSDIIAAATAFDTFINLPAPTTTTTS